MALSRTSHTAHLSTSSSTSTTTGSYTFASGSIVLAIVQVIADVGNENPGPLLAIDDTGADLTWTKVADIGPAEDDEYNNGIAAFVAIGNGTACTLTASKTGANAGRWYIRPYSWTGGNTSSPVGAIMEHAPETMDGAVTGTLSATPASDSDVISCAIATLNGGAAVAMTQGADQTELWDVQSDDWFISHGQVRTGSTSTSISWADVNTTGVGYYQQPVFLAVEIKAAAEGGGFQPAWARGANTLLRAA